MIVALTIYENATALHINLVPRLMFRLVLNGEIAKVNQTIFSDLQLSKYRYNFSFLEDNSHLISEIEEQLTELQKQLLDKADARKGFGTLAEEIDALREEKRRLLLEDANRGAARKRLETLEAFMEENDTKITKYDEKMVRLLIEKITVFDDRLVFTFKSGMETEVQM